jgi:hypothetical protein
MPVPGPSRRVKTDDGGECHEHACDDGEPKCVDLEHGMESGRVPRLGLRCQR